MATLSQLWALSSDGAVYVLQDVGAWLSSVRSNEMLHEKTTTVHDNWVEGVDGRFDKVICGSHGLVCAKKDKILYVRRGVSYDNPLGTSWAKALCDAQDLAVGSKCVVRRTSQDQLFVTNSIDLSSSIFLPHWNSVPKCTDVETHQLLVLDSEDNLFLTSPSSGDVFMCRNLSSGSPDDFKWEKLIGGPPMIKKQSSFFNILGWRSSSNGSVFSSVTAGDRCIWCLASGGKEIFQLVLKYVKKSRKARGEKVVNIEGSWKKFELPEKDEVTLFAAAKTEFDVLCAVVQENRSVISYAVLQGNSGRLEIPNPEGHTLRWRSISICAVTKPNVSPISAKILNSSKKSYPSIYPKLPPREDYDICCENGDCSFCRSASEEANNSSWFSTENFLTCAEERFEEGKEWASAVSAKRRSNEEIGVSEAKRSKLWASSRSIEEGETSSRKGMRRKRRGEDEFGDYYVQDEEAAGLVYLPKRSRSLNVHQLLVADIPFKIVDRIHDKVPSLSEHKVESVYQANTIAML